MTSCRYKARRCENGKPPSGSPAMKPAVDTTSSRGYTQFKDITPMMENHQMEKKMENEMETGIAHANVIQGMQYGQSWVGAIYILLSPRMPLYGFIRPKQTTNFLVPMEFRKLVKS